MPISLQNMLPFYCSFKSRLKMWDATPERPSKPLKQKELMAAPDHVKRDIGLLDGRAGRSKT